jgi:hypothetical protein
MVKLIKKALKWYFTRAAESYAMYPSCSVPVIRMNNC